MDVGSAFRDPDGDPLTYKATSSAPAVAAVAASASTVTVRAVAVGTATVTVTATDAAGSNTSAALAFRVTVRARARAAFTDDPIVPGVTPIKAVHFTELRERIDLLRTATGRADSGLLAEDLTDLLVAAGEAAGACDSGLMVAVDEVQYLSGDELAALVTAIHRTTQLGLPVLLTGAGLPQLPGAEPRPRPGPPARRDRPRR